MPVVLITGASGFVGRALCEGAQAAGYSVRAAVRVPQMGLPASETVEVGDLTAVDDWGPVIDGVDYVVHAAARAHVGSDYAANRALYLDTNARVTRDLVKASSSHGVRRFILLSTVKVNGEGAEHRSYTASDEPAPRDVYAESKLLAENHVVDAAAGTMQTAILRMPLVYGPFVRANFLRLMQWVDKERPLPLAALQNRRSFVSVWNLSSLIIRLLGHDDIPSRTWMVSDGEDLATPDLIRRLARLMGRRARLFPVPITALRLASRALGLDGQFARLCGSLTVDCSETMEELGWQPPLSVEEGLDRTVQWYLHGDSR